MDDPKTVTALVDQEYEGRQIVAGEVFAVTPIEAASRAYLCKVLLGESVIKSPEPAKPIRKRRAYKRRDLTAED